MKFKPYDNKKLFGKNIIPSCDYCRRKNGNNMESNCSFFKEDKNIENCKHFTYDPLKRKPTDHRHFKKNDYDCENFKL